MAGKDDLFLCTLLLSALLLLGEVDFSHEAAASIVPGSMFLKLKNITSTADFVDQFLTKADNSSGIITQASIPEAEKQDLVTVVATPALCEPRPTGISVPSHEDADKMYFPFCITLDRCGGCCGHDMLECIPTAIEYVNINLIQCLYPYPGADNFIIEFPMEGIAMERHLACSCECRIQPDDCNPSIHDYVEDSCSCVCKNEAQAFSCTTDQKWDHETCSCKCPTLRWCPMDEYFSNSTCKCETRPTNVPPPSQASDTGGSLVEDIVDPCQTFYCRAPFSAVFMGGQCVCQLSDSWGTYNLQSGGSRGGSRTRTQSRYPRAPGADPQALPLRRTRVPNHPQFFNLRKKRAGEIAP